MTNTPFTEPNRRRPRVARYCAECAARLITTRHPADYGNTVCHTCRAENPVAIDHRDGETSDERQLRAMTMMGEIAAPEAKPAPKPRCEFYHTLRAFYAAAQRAGLDTGASERMRQAFRCYFGRAISSRRELSAADWDSATYAVADGRLYW